MRTAAFVGIAIALAVAACGGDSADTPPDGPAATQAATETPAPDTSRVIGSGVFVTEHYEFADFTNVELTSAFKADISWSDTFSVSVEVDDNAVQLLEVTQDGDTLRFDLKEDMSSTNVTFQATIAMPAVSSLDLSAAAQVTISGFPNMDEFQVDLSGASGLDGELEVTLLDLRMSGASTASFTGSGAEATIDASGASMVELQDFILQIAHVEFSGTAQGTINVRDELGPVNVTGVSHLRYIGAPNVTGVDVGELSTFERVAH